MKNSNEILEMPSEKLRPGLGLFSAAAGSSTMRRLPRDVWSVRQELGSARSITDTKAKSPGRSSDQGSCRSESVQQSDHAPSCGSERTISIHKRAACAQSFDTL